MSLDIKQWEAQKRGWQTLNGLGARAIDFSSLSVLAETALDETAIEALLPQLGLNDEAINEFPTHLRPYCGKGLRIWQYPNQFAPYLAQLMKLNVQSYMELGIRHGGSFVATVEFLRRSAKVSPAIAVDILPCPSMHEYSRQSGADFWQINTQSAEFFDKLRGVGQIDLVMIDTHHEADQCLKEFESVLPYTNMIALHDVDNCGCPGVGETWRSIRARPEFHCIEFTQQYEGLGPFMGIGLAIKRPRWEQYCNA
jgi:hypothetical protein